MYIMSSGLMSLINRDYSSDHAVAFVISLRSECLRIGCLLQAARQRQSFQI